MTFGNKILILLGSVLLVACAESSLQKDNKSEEVETLSISGFIGSYSVYGTCPERDWTTGILYITESEFSITETGCNISNVTSVPNENAIIIELESCHAEGVSVLDERAKLSLRGGMKTLQYLPNADGQLRRDSRVFELTPCSRDET